ncbi:hypothetical protein DL765_006815 [Monosporascus sp. GIB2]|nr:hypothetical protein DL765_006815 [Monosporascus sp. GIB2]
MEYARLRHFRFGRPGIGPRHLGCPSGFWRAGHGGLDPGLGVFLLVIPPYQRLVELPWPVSLRRNSSKTQRTLNSHELEPPGSQALHTQMLKWFMNTGGRTGFGYVVLGHSGPVTCGLLVRCSQILELVLPSPGTKPSHSTVVISCYLLSLIVLGSTQTINGIFRISAPVMGLLYVAVIAARMCYEKGCLINKGPFTLGRWQKPISVVAILWVIFISVILFFWPSYPTTALGMSYAQAIAA